MNLKIFKSLAILLFLTFSCENSSAYQISGYCWSVYNEVSHANLPGYAYKIQANGNYAYIANYSSGLQIIDITDPANPTEVGTFDTTGSFRDLQIIGSYAYIADGDTGLRIVDVSSYSNPTQVGYFSIPDYSQGISVQGNYAYIAEYSDTTSGLWIIDISNPSTPTLAGFFNSPVPSYDVFVNGNYAYLANGEAGIQIIDISNPSNPTEVSNFSLPGFASRIVVNGNYAYVADGYYGLVILDITNPASPVEICDWATPDECVGVKIDGNYAYISNYYSGFQILDITDKANPIEFSNFVTPGRAWDIDISGSYAYIADDNQGVRVITKFPVPALATMVTLSGDSNLVTGIDSTGYYQFQNLNFGNYTVTASNDHYIFTPTSYIYSGLSSDENLQNFIGQPADVVTFVSIPPGLMVNTDIGTFQTPFSYSTVTNAIINIGTPSPQNVDSTQQLAFDSWNDDGPQSHAIQIISDTTLTVSFDTQFYLTTYVNPSGAGDIYASLYYGYIEYPDQYWTQYSLVTIYAEATGSNTQFDHWSGDLGGNSNLTTVLMDGPKTITANFSYTIATTPPYTINGHCFAFQTAGLFSLVGSYNNGNISFGVAEYGNYVYLSVPGANYNTGELLVLDVSTPSHPVQVNSYNLPNYFYWMSVNENYLYIPDRGSLFIYDISTPSSPNLIETYNQNFINDVTIVGTDAFLVGAGNFEILDISTPSNPLVIGSCALPGVGYKVAVEGNYAYVANYVGGLSIIDISSYSSPTVIGQFYTLGFSYNVKVSGNYAYLVNADFGLMILDISDPTSPQDVGNYNTQSDSLGITLDGDYAYLSDLVDGVNVLDIRNPQMPVEVTKLGGEYAFDMDYDENYLYSSNEGLNIYTRPQPLSAVTVSLSGDTTQTISTDSTGYYEFDNLIYGNYTVQASLGNAVFTPAYYNYSGLSTNELSQDFYGYETNMVTFYTNPPGLNVNINGTSYTTPYSFITAFGTSLSIGVNSQSIDSGAILCNFDSWSDGGAQNHTVNITSDTTFTVSFDSTSTDINFTSQVSNGFAGTVFPASGTYPANSILTCYVVTNLGWIFTGWGGDLSGTTNPQYLTLDQPKTIIANFTTYEYNNSMGDFDVASDTDYWGFELAPQATSIPVIGWYQDDFGLLTLDFSTDNQGIKMTSKYRFTPNSSNPWYQLQVVYHSSATGFEITPILLGYPDDTSLQIQEVGASYRSGIPSFNWESFNAPLYCRSSSIQLQLIVRSNGGYGAMNIDSIELLNQTPSVVTSSLSVNVPYGDFSVASDTSQWAFEIPSGANTSNGLPTVNWVPVLDEQTGVLALSFTTSYQGVKITSLDTFNIPEGHSTLLSFKVRCSLSDPTAIQITGLILSFNNETSDIWDIGGYGNVGEFAGDTWNTVYVPLTSFDKNTDRLQLIIKNTSQFPAMVYLDDVQLYYSPIAETEVIPPVTLFDNTDESLLK